MVRYIGRESADRLTTKISGGAGHGGGTRYPAGSAELDDYFRLGPVGGGPALGPKPGAEALAQQVRLLGQNDVKQGLGAEPPRQGAAHLLTGMPGHLVGDSLGSPRCLCQ